MFAVHDKSKTARQAAERFASETFDPPRKVGTVIKRENSDWGIEFQLVGGSRWYKADLLPNWEGWYIDLA